MACHILVVDDKPNSREGLRNFLMREGYEVETAGDACQAIQNMKECQPDVAIIELDLPPSHGLTLTGWDLHAIFRAFHPGSATILLCTEVERDIPSHTSQADRFELIEKPINPSELRTTLKRLRCLVDATSQQQVT